MTGPYLNDSRPPLTHQPEIQKYSYAIRPKMSFKGYRDIGDKQTGKAVSTVTLSGRFKMTSP